MSSNRVIGNNNSLIWNMPSDMKRFIRLTKGHHVIMGRKTYESMGKPLKGRINIVVTRQSSYSAPGCIVVQSLEEAIQKAEGDQKPFVIGGSEIYKQAIKYGHTIELTLIHHEFEGDAYFPEFEDAGNWELVQKESHKADEDNPYDYDFLTYGKREA